MTTTTTRSKTRDHTVRGTQRKGQTLLELVVASFLVAGVVMPALSLLRDSMKTSTSIENKNAMITLGVSKLEERLVGAANTFSDDSIEGDFSTDGYPTMRFRAVHSQDPADGGINGRLMTVTVTVWHDIDNNLRQEPREPSVTFANKLAKIATY